MVSPSSLAVLRLMISSNLVGCSTGKSPGLAPLRIFSLDGGRRMNMRRQNAEGYGSRCDRWIRAIGLTFTGILLVAASSHAGVLNVSWTAPTKNTEGSSLVDPALYRVYYSTSASPCPGSNFVQVAASTLIPSPNQTVSLQLTGLATGSTYRVSVTAVAPARQER